LIVSAPTGEAAGLCDTAESEGRSRRQSQSAPAISLMKRYENIELDSHKPKNGVHQDPRETVPRQFLSRSVNAINMTMTKTEISAACIPVRHLGR
jgi:hypothetical protein